MIGLNKMVQRKVPLGFSRAQTTHLWRGKAYSTQICTNRSCLINLVAVEGLFMALGGD